MRYVCDAIMILLLVAILTAYNAYQNSVDDEVLKIEELKDSVHLIEQQILYHSMMDNVPLNEYGYPLTVKPEWFTTELPRNTTISSKHPWLEVDKNATHTTLHPDIIVADGPTPLAGFWYNPTNGILRARIPQMISDQKTIEVYNDINRSNLRTLFTKAK